MNEQSKYRLVGLAVLLAVAVVVVPIFFRHYRHRHTGVHLISVPSTDTDIANSQSSPINTETTASTVQPNFHENIKLDGEPKVHLPPPPNTIKNQSLKEQTPNKMENQLADKNVVKSTMPVSHSQPQPQTHLQTKPVQFHRHPQSLSHGWIVQIASFIKKTNAHRLMAHLKSHGFDAHIKEKQVKGIRHYQVWVGSIVEKRRTAQILLAKVRNALHLKTGFVLKV